MPELRKDPISETWVIFSPERQRRPQFFTAHGEYTLTSENCPFCEGNEDMTPPEIHSLRIANTSHDKPGWKLRVIPNKYPALRVEGVLDKRADGFYDKMNGIGAHEVVIETTSHTRGIDEMEEDTVYEIFLAFKRRILDLKRDIRFRYIQVFKNHGIQAGATISHPHSQIVALPVIPARTADRLEHARSYFDEKDRCIFCDIVQHEIQFQQRMLLENGEFIVFAPYAPRLPFELSLYPIHHYTVFEEMEDAALRKLAVIFRDAVGKINKALDHPPYNMILHNAPFSRNNRYSEYFHWHIELLPIISGTGGFEIGTQSYINPMLPEESIKILNQ